jgi:hypothetical protein
MMPIARRILTAANDARMSGHKPIKARISPRDKRELEMWVRQQNQPMSTGLPAQNLSADHLYGMDIAEDAKVHEILVLEFEKR